MKRPVPGGGQPEDMDKEPYRDVRPTREWWLELGLDVLKTALVAALGILVREAADRIRGPRRGMYDPYDE